MPEPPFDDSIVARLASWYVRVDPCWPSPFLEQAALDAFVAPAACANLSATVRFLTAPGEVIYLALRHKGASDEEARTLLAISYAATGRRMTVWRPDASRPQYGPLSINEDYLSSKVCAANVLCAATLQLRMYRALGVAGWSVGRPGDVGNYLPFMDEAQADATRALAPGFVPPSRPALAASDFLGGEATLIEPTENVGPWAPDESAWSALMTALGQTVPTAGRGARTLAEGIGRIFG